MPEEESSQSSLTSGSVSGRESTKGGKLVNAKQSKPILWRLGSLGRQARSDVADLQHKVYTIEKTLQQTEEMYSCQLKIKDALISQLEAERKDMQERLMFLEHERSTLLDLNPSDPTYVESYPVLLSKRSLEGTLTPTSCASPRLQPQVPDFFDSTQEGVREVEGQSSLEGSPSMQRSNSL